MTVTEITRSGSRFMVRVPYGTNNCNYYGPFPNGTAARAFADSLEARMAAERKPSNLETFLASDAYRALVHGGAR